MALSSQGTEPGPLSRRLTRRRLLASAAALLAAPSGALAYALKVEPYWLDVERHELSVAGLDASLAGATLLHLSDLHIGVVDRDYLEQSFATARTLEPDFVAVTGDWVTYLDDGTFDALSRRLPSLPRGRLGTFGVLGNHDYGHDWQMPRVADRIQRLLEDAGIRLLRDEAATFAGLQVIGVEDLWGPFFGPSEVLRRRGEDASTLVLCHNPDAMDRDVWHHYRGWVLAGHTHGGQCKPPFLPPPILPVANRRYTAGRFAMDDGRRLYISRGLGYLRPVRFNARPEITLFTLRAG